MTTLPELPNINGVLLRHCPGWPGYAVGDNGTVWTAKYIGGQGRLSDRWRQLTPQAVQRGNYLTVKLASSEKTPIRVYVHKLVMEAFVGPRPPRMHTRHLDGNPHNCRLDNLAYGTPVENGADAVRHGRHYRENKGKLTIEQVRHIQRRLVAGERQQDIAKVFGVGQMTVSDIKTGRTWSHVTGIKPVTKKIAQCSTEKCVAWME